MSSVANKDKIVSMSQETLGKMKDAFQDYASKNEGADVSGRIEEMTVAMKKGRCVSVAYGKVIEWRNVLGCLGYTEIEKDLNFNFQYHM